MGAGNNCKECGEWLRPRFEYIERGGVRFAELVYRCPVCDPIRAVDADPKDKAKKPHAH